MKKNLQKKFMAKRPAMPAHLTYLGVDGGGMNVLFISCHRKGRLRFVSPLPALPRSITTVLRCVRSDLNLTYKQDRQTSASLKRRMILSLPRDISSAVSDRVLIRRGISPRRPSHAIVVGDLSAPSYFARMCSPAPSRLGRSICSTGKSCQQGFLKRGVIKMAGYLAVTSTCQWIVTV